MKTLALCAWSIATLAVVWEPSDFGILINVVAVAVLALIAWLVKKGVSSIEKSIDNLTARLTRTNGRLRIAELNIEAIAAKHGIKPRRYVEPSTEDQLEDEQ